MSVDWCSAPKEATYYGRNFNVRCIIRANLAQLPLRVQAVVEIPLSYTQDRIELVPKRSTNTDLDGI